VSPSKDGLNEQHYAKKLAGSRKTSNEKITRFTSLLVIVLTSALSIATVSSAAKAPSIRTVKILVLNLFYGQQQAARTSYNAMVQYNFTHNYPGAYARSAYFAAAAKYQAKFCSTAYYPDSTTLSSTAYYPDSTTLTRVSKWVAPRHIGGGWMFVGKTPKGYTYIVSATTTCVDGTGTSENALLHVTVLNNKAYFYFGIQG
jgi:type II secretory pathway pseudopilin PulG